MSFEEDAQLGLTLDLDYTAPVSELAEERWEAFENAVRVAHGEHHNETAQASSDLTHEHATAPDGSGDRGEDTHSGADSSEDDTNEANTEGGVVSHSMGDGADMTEADRQLLSIEHKKDAKRQLSEKEYKRWKKLRHKQSKKSSRSHKSDRRKDSEDSGRRRGRKERKSSSSRRKRSVGDTDGLSGMTTTTRSGGASSRRTRKRGRRADDGDMSEDGDGAKDGLASSRTRRRRRGGADSGGAKRKRQTPNSHPSDSDHSDTNEAGDVTGDEPVSSLHHVPTSTTTTGDAPFMTPEEAMRVSAGLLSGRADAADAPRRRTARREQLLRQADAISGATGNKGSQRLNASKDYARLQGMAQALVEQMRQARAKDELILAQQEATAARTSGTGSSPSSSSTLSQPPLYRIALKSLVEAQCRRSFFVGALIEAGVLTELSYWLYDFDHADPAPYELRTSALDTLLQFPIEGEIDSARRHLRNGDEDLTVFMGLSREHLVHTDLGRAVNALRLHAQEVPENRSKAVQLLARLSRAMSGGVSASRRPHPSRSRPRSSESAQAHMHAPLAPADAAAGVSWKCQGNRAVASPFEVVQTGSEAFQKAFMRPDPRDPTSYHNILPWRPPVSTITNLSGQLAEQIVQKDDTMRR